MEVFSNGVGTPDPETRFLVDDQQVPSLFQADSPGINIVRVRHTTPTGEMYYDDGSTNWNTWFRLMKAPAVSEFPPVLDPDSQSRVH